MKTFLFLSLILALACTFEITGKWRVESQCRWGAVRNGCPVTWTMDHKYGFECPYNQFYIMKAGSKYYLQMSKILGRMHGGFMQLEFDDSNWGTSAKGEK